MRSSDLVLGSALVACLLLAACGVPTWDPALHPNGDPTPADAGEDAWLKVHMQSGDLFVLSEWDQPGAAGDLTGRGVLFDADRVQRATGSHSIGRDSIALLETNRREVVSRFSLSGLSVFTTLTALTTVVCLADPKSCFGSCPTFYTTEDADRPLAEGFSSSFARALEARDIDRLGLVAQPGSFSLVMRNEAQETHAIRHVKLLAVPVGGADDVLLSTDGRLFATSATRRAIGCDAGGLDCLEATQARDDVEYASRADEHDLAVREEMILDFGPANGDLGLVLSARQSFVTTYVFYQSLAYAGRSAGDLLAALERGEPGAKERVLGVADELGGIEVLVQRSDETWELAGSFNEAGPIAADQQVVRLGERSHDSLRVKLRMARGSWRIDEIALATLDTEVEPTVLVPDSVMPLMGTDADDDGRLEDPEQYLVTSQGDAHRLWFTIPNADAQHLFLDSRGYYYEWMREGWLTEEDPVLAAAVLLQPAEALRMMAPGFKEIEPRMEELFWSSRFRR